MTDTPIGIIGHGAYVPDRVMTNDEWAQYVDTSDEWITSRTGIKERRLAAEHESTADLATAAARDALAHAGLTADALDEIILATDTPEVYTPDTSSFVQTRLGAGPIPTFDLGGSGCAGFVLGLDVARSRAREGKTVLVIGVELITRLIDWTDRNICVLFGDGAGAAVVAQREDAGEILAATAGTDGQHAPILQLECGGTRVPFNVENGEKKLHQNLVMKGREVFREAVAHMSAASRTVVEQAGVTLEDVALVIPHQANRRIIDAVGKELGLPAERVFVNVDRFGNTGSASVPLAMWDAREQGRLKRGDLVLLTAFGAGFHWASLLLRY